MRKAGTFCCKTIWNFSFEGDGQLFRSNRCTDYCEELYNLVYKNPITICPWCGEDLLTNKKLRFHIASFQKSTTNNQYINFKEIEKKFVQSGIEALKEKENEEEKEKSTTKTTTAAAQPNRMQTRSQTKLLKNLKKINYTVSFHIIVSL